MVVVVLVSTGFVQNWWGFNADSPSQVAVQFFDAVEDRDQEEAKKWATEECNGMVEIFLSIEYPELKYRVASEEIRGERAVVSYYKGKSSSLSELNMTRSRSKWKVSCKKENLIEGN
jgi:hypothetical protein